MVVAAAVLNGLVCLILEHLIQQEQIVITVAVTAEQVAAATAEVIQVKEWMVG
jgi:hypothetical protein